MKTGKSCGNGFKDPKSRIQKKKNILEYLSFSIMFTYQKFWIASANFHIIAFNH